MTFSSNIFRVSFAGFTSLMVTAALMSLFFAGYVIRLEGYPFRPDYGLGLALVSFFTFVSFASAHAEVSQQVFVTCVLASLLLLFYSLENLVLQCFEHIRTIQLESFGLEF